MYGRIAQDDGVIDIPALDVAYNPGSLCEPMRTNCRILPSGFGKSARGPV